MVMCLERGADLHMAELMPLPLTVSCFSKIQIGFTLLVPAHPGRPGKRAVKRVCVCVLVTLCSWLTYRFTGKSVSKQLTQYQAIMVAIISAHWLNYPERQYNWA